MSRFRYRMHGDDSYELAGLAIANLFLMLKVLDITSTDQLLAYEVALMWSYE